MCGGRQQGAYLRLFATILSSRPFSRIKVIKLSRLLKTSFATLFGALNRRQSCWNLHFQMEGRPYCFSNVSMFANTVTGYPSSFIDIGNNVETASVTVKEEQIQCRTKQYMRTNNAFAFRRKVLCLLTDVVGYLNRYLQILGQFLTIVWTIFVSNVITRKLKKLPILADGTTFRRVTCSGQVAYGYSIAASIPVRERGV